MVNYVVLGTEISNKNLREDHKPTPKEVARNTPQLFKRRAVRKEQQASTATVLTGGGIQDS
ncbi:hypothetical protein DPMN_066088 [Dreissena polymorpha]|uniref:Uncharacterized protein n=1 Tax=Dreissena polymorpha TaxID=45954 RepID=A0A9D4BRS3_DREPO|nr:hypothetical protein DPMN_066088 [Dreissena polymorpha]